MIPKKYTATTVGLIFTVISFLTTFTFIVPIIAMMSAVMFESIFIAIFGKEPFSRIGISVLLTYAMIFLLTTFFFLKRVKREKEFDMWQFIGYLLLEFFIVHPLGFYCYMASNWNMAGDGQLIMATLYTFPVTSLAFVILGVIVDIVKNEIPTAKNL